MLDRLQDVFKFLRLYSVEYVVIGGVAAILHGVPRATFDLDILIDATSENAARLLEALKAAGLGTAEMITADELLANEITIFSDKVRIDVQTSTPGLEFGGAQKRRLTMTYRGQDFFVASRDDVIASKRAAGRPIDLQDAEALEQGQPPPTA